MISFLMTGTVLLGSEYTICKEGDTLTHEQARLLVILNLRSFLILFIENVLQANGNV